MSEAQQIARKATHELQITEAAHAAFRRECIDDAIRLAKAGETSLCYQKLLMVVAIDGVRAKVLMEIDNATINEGVEKALAQANTPTT